jgi:pimeloyl-ACP methyl ester carboxylesterase
MTEHLTVPGGTIAYDVTGAGPLVLCLPGMGDTRDVYRDLVTRLVASGYRVATADIRGHGETSIEWGAYTQAALGDDAAALVEHLGGGPAVVIGHSFTPDSALAAAALLPDAVRAVVTIAPWASAPPAGRLVRGVMQLALRFPAFWGRFYRSLYAGTRPAWLDEHVDRVTAGLRRRGGTRGLRSMVTPTAKDPALRGGIDVPVLIVMGELDPDFKDPRAEAEQYASELAGATDLVMIPDAGHYPHAQQPDAVAGAIERFLARVGLAGQRA